MKVRKKLAKSNPRLISLLESLKKLSYEQHAPIWKEVAYRLAGSRRNYAEVNVSQLKRYTSEGATIVVPGIVLGSGSIDHEVTIAALRFSAGAREKIEKANGKCLSIEELMDMNPKGSNVIIMR